MNKTAFYYYTGLALLSILLISSKPVSNDQERYLFKLNDLEIGSNWKMIDHSESFAKGYIAFEDSKWMMKFIHWCLLMRIIQILILKEFNNSCKLYGLYVFRSYRCSG